MADPQRFWKVVSGVLCLIVLLLLFSKLLMK
ncbi:MAG: hypothetical protein ACI9FG_001483 [Crocinitomicaceae bacterium]|jgi:hypothetical protein